MCTSPLGRWVGSLLMWLSSVVVRGPLDGFVAIEMLVAVVVGGDTVVVVDGDVVMVVVVVVVRAAIVLGI